MRFKIPTISALLLVTVFYQNCSNVDLIKVENASLATCQDTRVITVSHINNVLHANLMDYQTSSMVNEVFEWEILFNNTVFHTETGNSLRVPHDLLVSCSDYKIRVNHTQCNGEPTELVYTHTQGCTTTTPAPTPEPPGPTPGPPAIVDRCRINKENLIGLARTQFQPEGFEANILSWADMTMSGVLFNGQPVYINYPFYRTAGALHGVPVGSFSLGTGNLWPNLTDRSKYNSSKSMKNRYISIPIIGDGTYYNFSWIGAFPYNEVSGPNPQSAFFYSPRRFTPIVQVNLTECPGDFRPAPPNVLDPLDPKIDPSLTLRCRNSSPAETGLAYGPKPENYNAFCHLEAGQKAYLNIIFVNVHDGINVGEEACWQPDLCEDPNDCPQVENYQRQGLCEISLKHQSTGN